MDDPLSRVSVLCEDNGLLATAGVDAIARKAPSGQVPPRRRFIVGVVQNGLCLLEEFSNGGLLGPRGDGSRVDNLRFIPGFLIAFVESFDIEDGLRFRLLPHVVTAASER